MPTVEEVLAVEVKKLPPSKVNVENMNTNLRVLYSFLETVSPTKRALQKKLTNLDAELASSTRRAEQDLKAKRAPVANDITNLGQHETKVVTKARELYNAILAAGGVPEAPPGRYLPSMKK